jgi:hypothetical protein
MQFTINTIAASLALFSAVSFAAPLQEANSGATGPTPSGQVTLEFLGDGQTERVDVTFNTPTVFKPITLLWDINSVTIVANFGFCTFWDNSLENKPIGQKFVTLEDVKAGNSSRQLTFKTPVRVGSFFCADKANTKPVIPLELTSKSTVPALSNSTTLAAASVPKQAIPSVTAPVAAQGLPILTGSPLITATEWVTIQITGPLGINTPLLIPTTGHLTVIPPQFQNAVSIIILEEINVACTFYGPKLVVFGQATQFNGERTSATWTAEQQTLIPVVQCIPRWV